METDMQLNKLLNESGISFFLVQSGEQANLVVSAIHHAPAGISNLPCERHKVSDESVGYIALTIATNLKSSLIIASNYFLDINKPDPSVKNREENTDYLTWLSHNRPQILVEIHGHSGENAKADIEISSGKHRQAISKDFAQKLQKYAKQHHFKRNYSISGDYDTIYYKASEAVTINTNNWLAFHIELCPELRKDNKEANKIAKCISLTLKEILSEGNHE